MDRTPAQGKTVTFTISADENVTAIIAPQVQCIPAPCPNQLMSYRAFNYSTGNQLDGPGTTVNAVFMSEDRVEGLVSFRAFPGCGSAMSVTWSATKR